MSAEEDTELRDLIIQTLETNGVIGKIKAELRATVFLALEEEGSFRDKIPLVNTKLIQFLSKSEGILAVSLVREFLQFFNLDFTLAVFDPEIAASCSFLSKEELRRKLKLVDPEVDSPVVMDLIKLTNKQSTISPNQDNQKVQEPNVVKVSEGKSSFDESRSSFISNNHLKLMPDLSNKLTESNYEDPGKSSEGSGDFTGGTSDPFFDEPLPLEKRPYFALTNDDSQKDMSGVDLLSFKTETKGLEKSSLASLKDLPSLNMRNSTDVSDWDLGNKSTKKKVSSVDLDIMAHASEGDYDDDEDFHSSASGHSAKSSQNSLNVGQPKTDATDNHDNSEQSIEEEIEEELSGGVDDLLNSSLSLGDDATTDQTISQVSLVVGSDYMEPCKPLK